MPKIALLNYPSVLLSSISFPIDILSAAADLANIKTRSHQQLTCDILSLDEHYALYNKPAKLSPFQPKKINPRTNYDLIILPAIWGNPKPIIQKAHLLNAWLQTQYQHGALICAVGTASCFLAEAKLLDQQAATTHWFYFDNFAKQYPQVKLQRQHHITQSNRIFCAASINALADLCIYFSEQFFGKEIAKQLESHFSPEIRRPVDQQLYNESAINSHDDELVSQAQYWLKENYMNKLNIQKLAKLLKTSPRNLSRRFKKTIGKTPNQFLNHCRLEIAKTLLKDSNLSIAEIASQTAFSDSSHFIRLFKQDMQTTPQNFRRRIRNKLFT